MVKWQGSSMKAARLTTSESLALDVIRVVAAAVVALGHLSIPMLSTGWPDFLFLARWAVTVFFILSGFVIRYITCLKPTTLGHYLGDRASRIYSIAIPALLFTWVADTISRHVNPGFFATWEPFYSHPLARILVNLAFCGQLWAYPVHALSNGPFWSVNYEVAYYLLYGCWFYLSGRRRWISIGILCILFGPRVLYLAPLWILGCVLHDLYQRWNHPASPSFRFTCISLGSLGLLTVFYTIVCILIQHGRKFGPPAFMRISLSSGVLPFDYLFGLAWAGIFLVLLYLARQVTLTTGGPFIRAVQFLAEGTFPIYLLHLPFFILVASSIPYNHGSTPQKLLLLAVGIVVGVLAGHPGNIFKKKIRSLIFSSL